MPSDHGGTTAGRQPRKNLEFNCPHLGYWQGGMAYQEKKKPIRCLPDLCFSPLQQRSREASTGDLTSGTRGSEFLLSWAADGRPEESDGADDSAGGSLRPCGAGALVWWAWQALSPRGLSARAK
jgi:hypothetical protein